MATYHFVKAAPVDVDALCREITDAGLPGATAITFNPDDATPAALCLHVSFAAELSSGEQAALAQVVSLHSGQPYPYTPDELDYYLKRGVTVTDPRTGISGPFEMMQPLVNRRELFNDADSPLHLEDFTPILGAGGWAQQHASRIANLENIHAKAGWHSQEIRRAKFRRPADVLFYYGYPNSYNSLLNGWNNERVAQDMARFGVVVLGAGVEDPAHPDYANTQVIIPRVKVLNPFALIFGYVTANQSLADFTTKAGRWNSLGVHGIFMDEAGYDYGKTRVEFNERVDTVHGQATANRCFANAWNLDHVLGIVNDPSYPNTAFNPGLIASHLGVEDWVLLESFGVNTSAYTATGLNGHEPKAQWAARGVKAIGLRAAFGVNVAAVGIINDDNPNGQTLFNFAFTGAMAFSLDAMGTSSVYYGASTAQVKLWTRPDVSGCGGVWTLNPSVQLDVNDANVYRRFAETARFDMDFTSNAQASAIVKW